MILFPISLTLLFLFLQAESCIVADKTNKQDDPLLGNKFDNPQQVYAYTKLEFESPSLIANIERNLKFWATWDIDTHTIKLKSLNGQFAKVNKELHITAMVAELDLRVNIPFRYFLLVLQDSHVKYIGQLSTSEEADGTQSEYMKNVAKREKIPIWESCQNYKSQAVFSYPGNLVITWITEKGYNVTNIWENTLSTRYIFALQHTKANESHSHYRFMSVTIDKETPKINFVGGHMRTSRLAEYSATNFLMLDPELTTGTWNDDAKVTWGILQVSMNLKTYSAKIGKAISGKIPEKIKVDPGVPEPLKVEYRIGLVPMSLPCPNSAKMEQLLCQNAVDHYWLQAVVEDNKSGKHVLGLLLQFQNNAFNQIVETEYIGFLTHEQYLQEFDKTAIQKVEMYVPQVQRNEAPPVEAVQNLVQRERRSLFQRSNTVNGLSQVQVGEGGPANDSRTPQSQLGRAHSFLRILRRGSSAAALFPAGAPTSTQ